MFDGVGERVLGASRSGGMGATMVCSWSRPLCRQAKGAIIVLHPIRYCSCVHAREHKSSFSQKRHSIVFKVGRAYDACASRSEGGKSGAIIAGMYVSSKRHRRSVFGWVHIGRSASGGVRRE
eukprot:IDg22488t1